MLVSRNVRSLECVVERERGTKPSLVLTTALLAVALGPPFIRSDSGRADSSRYSRGSAESTNQEFVCGYDPHGASDEWSNHKLNIVGLGKRGDDARLSARTIAAGISVEDA